jgi:hypothetical protein
MTAASTIGGAVTVIKSPSASTTSKMADPPPLMPGSMSLTRFQSTCEEKGIFA